MISIVMLVRPVEPKGQWTTSAQATSATENMGMRQYVTDNAPATASGRGGISLTRDMTLRL